MGELAIEELDAETLRARLGGELRGLGGLAAAARGEQRLLVLLGLLPAGYDAPGSLLDLLGMDQPAVYSRVDKRLYLGAAASSLGGAARLAVAHEVVHALQDQHFDLTALRSSGLGSGDRLVAVNALVEGDAMLTIVRWGRAFLTPADKRSLPSVPSEAAELIEAPLVVREALLFPHQQGRAFVQALHDVGGYDAVNQAFLAPPSTTEQVIHPEKYGRRELPRTLALPDLAQALGERWRLQATDVLGELRLRILIEQFTTRGEADVAAAGWDGDRVVLFEDEDARAIAVLATAWDTDGDAVEFYNAYGRSISARFGTNLRRTLDVPSLNRWATPIGQVQLLKTGDRVLVIVAPDEVTLDAISAQFR